MECKACKYPDSRVVSTERNDKTNQIQRRRECIKCGSRFSTQEQLRETPHRTQPPIHILPK